MALGLPWVDFSEFIMRQREQSSEGIPHFLAMEVLIEDFREGGINRDNAAGPFEIDALNQFALRMEEAVENPIFSTYNFLAENEDGLSALLPHARRTRLPGVVYVFPFSDADMSVGVVYWAGDPVNSVHENSVFEIYIWR